jgi:hypothetical protein
MKIKIQPSVKEKFNKEFYFFQIAMDSDVAPSDPWTSFFIPLYKTLSLSPPPPLLLLLNGADGITQHTDTLSLIITISLYTFTGGDFIFLLTRVN